jgi:MFS transporter, PAT family, beta-lactamase induction signal transducer AmpG
MPESNPSPPLRSARKIGLLTSLYFSQGLPSGFFSSALPVLLRLQGMSLPDITKINLLSLPWALKFLWAPFLDRYSSRRLGRRRGWILPLQGLAVLMLALISSLDPAGQLGLILAAVLVISVLAATQDIATDGLAVELLNERERGLGNGIQVAAYRVGMIVGGGVLLKFIGSLRWQKTFLIMAVLLAVAALPILLHRERRRIAAPKIRWEEFLRFFTRPGMGLWMLLLALFKGGDAVATGIAPPFLVDLGMTATEIGNLYTYGTLPAGLLGALLGGWAVGRIGRRRALITFGIFQGLMVAAYTLPAVGLYTTGTLYATAIADYAAGGMATAVIFTMMMDVCRPGTEGSDYTIQASVAMTAPILARSLAGDLADSFGYAPTFLLSGGLSLAGVALAAVLLANAAFRRRLLAADGTEW